MSNLVEKRTHSLLDSLFYKYDFLVIVALTTQERSFLDTYFCSSWKTRPSTSGPLRCSCKFVYVCTQFVVVFLTFNGHQNPRPGLTRPLHTPCWSFPLAQHWFLSQSPSDEQNPGWGLQNPPTQWSPSLQSYLLLHWRFLHLSTKAETLTRINLWITTLFLEKIYKAGRITKKLY